MIMVLMTIQFFEFKALGYDKGQAKNEKNEEVKAALWPPGYFPGMQTKNFFLWLYMKDSTEGIPEVYLQFFPCDTALSSRTQSLLPTIGCPAVITALIDGFKC
uniref:CUB domain-containing protein n=1 Tax=Angiostrongylus cantonensis TaxID=6313 RepID=A0A0K0CV25_ANGCA